MFDDEITEEELDRLDAESLGETHSEYWMREKRRQDTGQRLIQRQGAKQQ